MANEQANKPAAITEEELKALMSTMASACDVVRVVDPSTFAARTLSPGGEDFAPAYRCYSALCHSRRCENCISMRAVDENRSVSKFEFVDGDAYFITARPVELDGTTHSLEVVQKVSDDIGLHDGLDELQEHVQEETDQEFIDAFTGAYTRRYFDEGLQSMRGRKLALVKVDGLAKVNQEDGYPEGDLVLKHVAHEVQRKTRIVDTVVRYKGDQFVIQFEDMDSAPFAELVQKLYDSATAKVAEEHPQLQVAVTIVAVDEASTFGALAEKASDLMAKAEAAGQHVVVESADSSHQAHVPVRGAETNETLHHASDRLIVDIDELTGLYTSSAIRIRLQRVLEERHTRDDGFYLLYLDIENFKQYNRAYGRTGGDRLLKYLGDSVLEQFPSAIASRVSGDVFLVIASDSDLEERLTALRELVASYQKRLTLELKAGVLNLDEAVKDASAAIDMVKVACESIKGRYDLGVRYYDSKLDQEISMNEYVVNNIENAMAQGHIKVFYQPIIRAMTGNVCDYEALCRWDDPQHGLLSPAVFIPALEKFRLISKVDAYIVRQVCQHQADLLAQGKLTVPVSVNLSRLDFQLDIFQVVEDAVAEAGIPRSLLTVEVTESAMDEDDGSFKEQVERFRSAGYEVWMDDFGSGYSSLNLLKDYRFDTVKIDMAFLAGFEDNPKSREIIVSIVDMGKKLGMRTLIEGVETKQQCRFLQRIGCEMLQGYFFGRPCPYSEDDFSEFAFEDTNERAYFDRLGSVNLLGAQGGEAAVGDGVTESELRSAPVALVEYRAGSYTYLSANEAYLEFLEVSGERTIDELHDDLTSGALGFSQELVGQLDETRASGRETSCVFSRFGEDYQVHVRPVASNSGAHAFTIFPLPLS